MTRAQMEALVQAAILASSLSNNIKNQRVAISLVALDALLPTDQAVYKADTITGSIHPEEIQAVVQPLIANRKAVYRMMVE